MERGETLFGALPAAATWHVTTDFTDGTDEEPREGIREIREIRGQ